MEEEAKENKSNLTKRQYANDLDNEEDWEDDSSENELDFSKPLPKHKKNKEAEMEEEQIDVDFEFADPQEAHFFSVKTFLNGYLDGLSFKSSELAEIIISQPEVGTVVGVSDEQGSGNTKDKDVLGFATILNPKLYEKKPVINEILQFIKEKSLKHNEQHEKLAAFLESSRIGLLINERIINLDPSLVPTLHLQILEDLKWIKEESIETKEYFELDYILYITKIYKEINKSKQKKVKSQGSGLKEYIYPKFEDYHLILNAEQYFMFEANTTKNNAGLTNLDKEYSEELCLRGVILIEFKKFKKCLGELNQYLEG